LKIGMCTVDGHVSIVRWITFPILMWLGFWLLLRPSPMVASWGEK